MKSLNSTTVTSGSTLTEDAATEGGVKASAAGSPVCAPQSLPTNSHSNTIGATLRKQRTSPSNCRYRSGGMTYL
ncbi:MAG: hypothetical protein ABSF53_02040 [Terracidiphilus sp.]